MVLKNRLRMFIIFIIFGTVDFGDTREASLSSPYFIYSDKINLKTVRK